MSNSKGTAARGDSNVVSLIDNDDEDDTSSEPFIPQHNWTEFEMNTVLALLCKGVHKGEGGILTFATELNESLNRGGGSASSNSSSRGNIGPRFTRPANYDADIPVEEVAALLAQLRREKKAALNFIDRHPPARITRAKKRAFDRSIGFDGSLREWAGGRREAEMAHLPERMRQVTEQLVEKVLPRRLPVEAEERLQEEERLRALTLLEDGDDYTPWSPNGAGNAGIRKENENVNSANHRMMEKETWTAASSGRVMTPQPLHAESNGAAYARNYTLNGVGISFASEFSGGFANSTESANGTSGSNTGQPPNSRR